MAQKGKVASTALLIAIVALLIAIAGCQRKPAEEVVVPPAEEVVVPPAEEVVVPPAEALPAE